MSQQLALFAPKSRLPVHTYDPETSVKAARKYRDTGKLRASQERILRLLCQWTGEPPTAGELSGGDLKLRHEINRRMSELAEVKLVERHAARPCRVLGNPATTWWPTTAGRAAIA